MVEQRTKSPLPLLSLPITDAKESAAREALHITHRPHQTQTSEVWGTTAQPFSDSCTSARQKWASTVQVLWAAPWSVSWEMQTAAPSHTSAPGMVQPGLGGNCEPVHPWSCRRELTWVRTKKQHHTMGRSDLIHTESPAPSCGGALQTGFSEQSRAWFPSRNSSPLLGLHGRKWQGAISYTVRSWEPHQPGAPHLQRFPCRLLLFQSTLPPGIQRHTRNSVSGWQLPACKEQQCLSGPPPKAMLGIPAALKGSLPGYHAL